MALGFVGGYGAKAAQDALRRIEQEQIAEALRQQQEEQRQFVNMLSLRRMGQDDERLRIADEENAIAASKFTPLVRPGMAGPDGKPVTAAFHPITGERLWDAAEAQTPVKPEAVTDYGEFLRRYAQKVGKPYEQLTADDELAARKLYGQADDRPYRAPVPIIISGPQGPMIADRTSGTAKPIMDAGGEQLGLAPTADMRNRVASTGRAVEVLNSIDELSNRINTQEGVMARIVGGVEKAKAQANLADDMAEYQALIAGFTPLMARALGHTGVLTEQDVQSTREVFPKAGDSKAVRDRKIARIKKIWQGMMGADNPAQATTSGAATIEYEVRDGKLVRKGG